MSFEYTEGSNNYVQIAHYILMSIHTESIPKTLPSESGCCFSSLCSKSFLLALGLFSCLYFFLPYRAKVYMVHYIYIYISFKKSKLKGFWTCTLEKLVIRLLEYHRPLTILSENTRSTTVLLVQPALRLNLTFISNLHPTLKWLTCQVSGPAEKNRMRSFPRHSLHLLSSNNSSAHSYLLISPIKRK